MTNYGGCRINLVRMINTKGFGIKQTWDLVLSSTLLPMQPNRGGYLSSGESWKNGQNDGSCPTRWLRLNEMMDVRC